MSKVIHQKEMLIKALSTLFFSWGSDTPDEVFWGVNDLLAWYEKEFDVQLNIRFERDESTYDINYEEVIQKIRSL